jgi:hypothetical protein
VPVGMGGFLLSHKSGWSGGEPFLGRFFYRVFSGVAPFPIYFPYIHMDIWKYHMYVLTSFIGCDTFNHRSNGGMRRYDI